MTWMWKPLGWNAGSEFGGFSYLAQLWICWLINTCFTWWVFTVSCCNKLERVILIVATFASWGLPISGCALDVELWRPCHEHHQQRISLHTQNWNAWSWLTSQLKARVLQCIFSGWTLWYMTTWRSWVVYVCEMFACERFEGVQTITQAGWFCQVKAQCSRIQIKQNHKSLNLTYWLDHDLQWRIADTRKATIAGQSVTKIELGGSHEFDVFAPYGFSDIEWPWNCYSLAPLKDFIKPYALSFAFPATACITTKDITNTHKVLNCLAILACRLCVTTFGKKPTCRQKFDTTLCPHLQPILPKQACQSIVCISLGTAGAEKISNSRCNDVLSLSLRGWSSSCNFVAMILTTSTRLALACNNKFHVPTWDVHSTQCNPDDLMYFPEATSPTALDPDLGRPRITAQNLLPQVFCDVVGYWRTNSIIWAIHDSLLSSQQFK